MKTKPFTFGVLVGHAVAGCSGYITSNGRRHTNIYPTRKAARKAWRTGERMNVLSKSFLQECKP